MNQNETITLADLLERPKDDDVYLENVQKWIDDDWESHDHDSDIICVIQNLIDIGR